MTETYRVCGPRAVAGVPPGGALELADDTALHLPALIAAGHLEQLAAETVVDLEALTVPQLRAYAAKHRIELGDASRKGELVDVISRAPVSPPVPPAAGVQLTGIEVPADGTEHELTTGGDT